nr:phage tail tape measure protein [uncultured Mediterranean phage uvMED]BAR23128.1 phage tail tape measure protein [uncultured Mediterranean phage uvMED]
MADYGVNIAVAVKNSQAVTQLSNKIKETASRIEDVNNRFNTFANMTGKVIPGSIANFNKALSDASKNLNNAALGTEAATKAAKEYINAQDQANAALREQKELLRSIRQTASPADHAQPADGFSAERGQAQTRARLLALETQKKAKAAQTVFNAERKFADQLFAIEMSLSKKARDAEIDNIIEQYRIENQLQDNLFKRMIEISDKKGKKFMEDLGQRKNAELTAIAEIDKARKKARGEAVRLTGQTSPIGGAVGIPGSPAALRAAERAERIRSAQGSALIGGAFPLLFGQGAGAALGGGLGGFGGGMVGGEFGFGLSLVGTQIGSLVDQLIEKTVDLGSALNPLTADTNAIIAAVGKTNTEFASLIDELEAAGQSTLALQLATEDLEKVVGQDGVEALEVFSAGIKGLQNDFTVFITQLSAAVAKGINALTGETAFVREIRDLNQGVFQARQSEDPQIIAALAELDKLQGFGVDPKDRIAAQEKIVKLLKEGTKAQRDSIRLAQKEEERLETQIKANELAKESRYVVAAQLDLARAGNDLTNEAVVLAEKELIQERFLAEARGTLEGSQERLLAADRKKLALQELANRVLAAETAERERQEKTVKSTNLTAAETGEGIVRRLRKQIAAYEELDPFARKMAVIEAERENIQERINKVKSEEKKIELELMADKLESLKIKKEEQKIDDQIINLQLKKEDSINAENEKLSNTIDSYSDQLRLLQAKINGTEEQVALEMKLEKAGSDIERNYIRQIDAQTKVVEQLEKQKQLYASIGSAIEAGIVDSLTAAVEGTKSLAEVASQTLRQVASILLQFGVRTALGGIPGLEKFFPGRALGGPVSAQKPYMVGERGPELFVPGAQGNIVPNNAMGGANVVVNVDASGSQAQGNQPNAKALGSAIGAAVQAELIKQKRPGGLLA